jgi:hypothetical protein
VKKNLFAAFIFALFIGFAWACPAEALSNFCAAVWRKPAPKFRLKPSFRGQNSEQHARRMAKDPEHAQVLLSLAQENFDAMKVKVQLRDKDTLEILPEEGSYLNHLAKRLWETRQVKLVYSPKILFERGSLAIYFNGSRQILIPEALALQGIFTTAFFHELKHATLFIPQEGRSRQFQYDRAVEPHNVSFQEAFTYRYETMLMLSMTGLGRTGKQVSRLQLETLRSFLLTYRHILEMLKENTNYAISTLHLHRKKWIIEEVNQVIIYQKEGRSLQFISLLENELAFRESDPQKLFSLVTSRMHRRQQELEQSLRGVERVRRRIGRLLREQDQGNAILPPQNWNQILQESFPPMTN